jgi:hypothetical protein
VRLSTDGFVKEDGAAGGGEGVENHGSTEK